MKGIHGVFMGMQDFVVKMIFQPKPEGVGGISASEGERFVYTILVGLGKLVTKLFLLILSYLLHTSIKSEEIATA